VTRRRDEPEVLVVPLHAERLRVAKRGKERYRVRVTKRVESRDEVVVAASVREDVHVERVPVNRTVQEAPAVRYEGTTIIVPIVEETFVVEKKLVLREELRISRVPVHEPRSVTVSLRREIADVRRVDGEGDEGSKSDRKEGQHANGGRFVRKSQRGERDAR
jgi:uncharacterized protein (TIGR02271 family)